jgi:hypothetical protein
VKTYPLSPTTIRRQLWRAFFRFQVAMFFILMILASYLFSDPPLRWVVGLPIFLVVLAVYAWITITHFRRELNFLRTLRVDLTERDLRLHTGFRPPAAVSRDDVYAVQELHEGLYVSTYDYKHVTVPFGLDEDGDEQVRDTLSSWKWIRPIPAYRYLSDWPLFIGLMVSMIVLILVNSLVPALIVGGSLALYYLIVYLRVRWVYDLDPQVFHSYTMALMFMIFIILMKLCLLIPMAAMR